MQEWQQVAKICQFVLLPHMSESARRRMGDVQVIPSDLLDSKNTSRGMSKSDLRTMRGAFQNVETFKASDVRVISKDES